MTAGRRVVRIWLVDGVVVADGGKSEFGGRMIEAAESAVDDTGPVPALAAVDFMGGDPNELEVDIEPDPPAAGPVAEAVAESCGRGRSGQRWSVLDTTTLVLLAVRLRSRGDLDRVRLTVAMLVCACPSDVDRLVPELLERELLRSRGPARRLSLTPRGSEKLVSALASATDAVGRPTAEGAYQDFLHVNFEFLSTLSSWQSRLAGRSAEGSVDEFCRLVGRIEPAVGRLSRLMPRFAGYQPRFTRALGRAVERSSWIDSPALDSVHTVWFELHEHLLATLGRSRTQEH